MTKNFIWKNVPQKQYIQILSFRYVLFEGEFKHFIVWFWLNFRLKGLLMDFFKWWDVILFCGCMFCLQKANANVQNEKFVDKWKTQKKIQVSLNTCCPLLVLILSVFNLFFGNSSFLLVNKLHIFTVICILYKNKTVHSWQLYGTQY